MTQKVKLTIATYFDGEKKYAKTVTYIEQPPVFEIPDDAVITGAGVQGYGSGSTYIIYATKVKG